MSEQTDFNAGAAPAMMSDDHGPIEYHLLQWADEGNPNG
jgi:hypothetical protein